MRCLSISYYQVNKFKFQQQLLFSR